MTLLRQPRSFAEAATQVAAAIGYPEAGKLVGRSGRTVYQWANPATKTCPSVAQALLLDTAFRAAGGGTSPFGAAYLFQLDEAVEHQDACRDALAADVATAARELGDAIAAALALVQPNASPREAHRAFAEAAEAADALAALQRRVCSFLPAAITGAMIT